MHPLKPIAALALTAALAACDATTLTSPVVPAPTAAPTGAGIVGNGGSNLNVPNGGPNLQVPNGGPNLNVPTGGANLNVPTGGPHVVGPNGAAAIGEGTRAPAAPTRLPGAAASTAPTELPNGCEAAFAAADTTDDDALTPAELAAAGYDARWAEHDADGSGGLDEAEFCAMAAGPSD